MRLVVCVLSLMAASPAWAGQLRFKVPDGWTNLSPDAPATERAKAPPAVQAAIAANRFVFYAMDLDGSDGFMENVSAMEVALPVPLTASYMNSVLDSATDEVKQHPEIRDYRFLERGMTTVGGVPAGRVVAASTISGIDIRQVVYLIPGGSVLAIVTYTTQANGLARYTPIFDAAARATTGVRQPPINLGRFAPLVGGVLGGLAIVLFLSLRERARQKRAREAWEAKKAAGTQSG